MHTLDVRDGGSGALLRTIRMRRTIDLGRSGNGFGLLTTSAAVSAATGRVFVADGSTNAVSILDGRDGSILRTVMVGRRPGGLVVDDRAHRIFVVNEGDGAHPGTVSVLDATSGNVVDVIPVGVVGTAPAAIALDAARGHVFVVNVGNRTVSVLDANLAH